jgi:hypothetical protein
MAILLDVYLGVPVIYSTFMQYDELAHHFGPSSRQALSDLKRTDARIGEILRMIRAHAGRPYDLVVLSDHGMTPAASYRVEFGETLGRTVQRALDEFANPALSGPVTLDFRGSSVELGPDEYADALGVRAEQREAAADEARLERARLRVEAGVQQRGVRLARAGADIATGLEQRDPQAVAAELARDRGADDAGAHDDDVALVRGHPARPASAAAAARQRSRRSAASSAPIVGSNVPTGCQSPTAAAGESAPPAPSRANAPTPSAVASADG